MLQARVKNPNGPGDVWSSPERDIAHALPGYIVRSCEIMAADMPDEQLEAGSQLVALLRQFMTAAVTATDMKQLITSTLAQVDPDVAQRFEHWFTRVIMCAYVAAVQDVHGTATLSADMNTRLDAVTAELKDRKGGL